MSCFLKNNNKIDRLLVRLIKKREDSNKCNQNDKDDWVREKGQDGRR